MKRFLIFLPAVAFSISLISTPHADIFFPSWLGYAAQDLAWSVETYWASVTSVIGNDPKHVTIYLGYAGNYVNGFADPVGKRIVVIAYPMPSKFLNFEDWYSTVFVHEFTHISHLTIREGIPKAFQKITGVPLLDSEFRSPFVESTTVYDESTLVKGGRLRNPLVKSLVENSVKGGWIPPLVRVSDPPVEDFLGRSLYYYVPSSFYAYLVKRYGMKKMREFLKESSKNVFGIGMDSTAKKLFGKRLEDLYEDWKGSLKFKEKDGVKKTVFEKRNVLIAGLENSRKRIWVALRRFGESTLYKYDGVEIGIIRNGEFEKKFSVYGYGGNLRVDGGKVYYLIHTQNGKCCQFPYLDTAIAVWDGKERILKRGNITAFDVKDGHLYWSEYNPKSGTSKVVTPEGKVRINGIVREMIASSKTYLLISRRGESSVLWINGREIHDESFKYSLKRCGNDVCFLKFDEDGSNLYRFNGRLEKITKNISALDYTFVNSELMVSMFSKKFPGTGIYAAYTVQRASNFTENPEKGIRNKRYEIRNGNLEYTLETLKPIVHIPLAFKENGSWKFSLALGGYSPNYDVFWIAAPTIGEDGISFSGGLLIDTGKFSVLAYKILDNIKASANLELIRKRLDSDSILSIGLYGNLSSSCELGASLNLVKGSSAAGLSVGFDDKSPELSTYYEIGFENLKLIAEYSYPLDIKLSATFPILETDFGILDPYFHVSHVFSKISFGYKEEPYLETLLGFEEGDFLTYTRNFPEIGLKISKSGVSLTFDVGM